MTTDSGRVGDADRALVSDQAAARLDAPRFDPSRLMELFCAVANARYALEYWDREARWTNGQSGKLPYWAGGPAERGAGECETLREIEKYLRSLMSSDSDGNPEGGDGTAPSQRDDSAAPQGDRP